MLKYILLCASTYFNLIRYKFSLMAKTHYRMHIYTHIYYSLESHNQFILNFLERNDEKYLYETANYFFFRCILLNIEKTNI